MDYTKSRFVRRNEECAYRPPGHAPPEHPLVSVSIVTYRHAAYIRQCLDSILMQKTDFPFEIILGEDDSPDGNRDICIDYAKAHPGVIRLFLRSREDVIHINGKPSGRFNSIGNIHAARGTYIALLEGDDYWTDPRKLQKQFDFMQQHPDCTFSFHSATTLQAGDDQRIGQRRFRDHPVTLDAKDVIALGGGDFFATAGVMYRREAILPIPDWYLQAPVGDYSLALLCADRGRLAYIDENMAAYRTGVNGGWTTDYYKDFAFRMASNLSAIQTLQAYDRHTQGRYRHTVQTWMTIKTMHLVEAVMNQEHSCQEAADMLRRPEYRAVIRTLPLTKRFGAWVLMRNPAAFTRYLHLKASVLFRLQGILWLRFLNRFDEFVRSRQGRECAVFGAGNYGRRVMEQLEQAGIPVACFMDNSPGKWGQTLRGKPIVSPDQASPERFVFVASTWYPEICRQLEKQGLKRHRHYLVVR